MANRDGIEDGLGRWRLVATKAEREEERREKAERVRQQEKQDALTDMAYYNGARYAPDCLGWRYGSQRPGRRARGAGCTCASMACREQRLHCAKRGWQMSWWKRKPKHVIPNPRDNKRKKDYVEIVKLDVLHVAQFLAFALALLLLAQVS